MKKRLALVVSILMLAGMVLAGCTTSAPVASATPAPTVAPTPEPTATPEPAPTEILRFGTGSLEGKFNPILATDTYDNYVVSMLFDGLVLTNPDGSINNKGLAESWTVSEDHLTYTFKLRDAKFHNGDPFTAEDVKFTYTALADPKYDGTARSWVADIVGAQDVTDGKTKDLVGVKVIDPKTVSITITAPNAVKMYDFGAGILDHEYYAYTNWEEFKAKNANPVGTGIFKFKDYTPGQACNLVLNNDYFGKKPALAGVSVLIIPNETQIQALQAGQVDIVNPSCNKDNFDALSAIPTATALKFPSNGYNFIGMNFENPIFQDKKVRQALNYGCDFNNFVQTEWQGLASRSLCPIATVSWAYPDVSELNNYPYDPEKAKSLLEEAGWKDTDGDGIREKDGKKLSFTWISYTDAPWPGHLIALATEQWKLIGVDLKSELTDFNTVVDRVFTKQQFEMFNMGWSLTIDPDPGDLFTKAGWALGANNPIHYYNERVEQICKDGKIEFDQAKRTALYKEFAKIVNDDLPYIFCANRDEIWGVSKKFQGFEKMNPIFNWVLCLDQVTATK